MCKEHNNSNNKDDSIRKSTTFPTKKKNHGNDTSETNESNETSKILNKINNIVTDKTKNNNESNSNNKNKLLYEKIGKKINYNNINTNNNIYNNYNNMKLTKTNNIDKNYNLNKTLNSSYINNSMKSNVNSLNKSKKKRNIDKKLSQFAAKINNYNKSQMNNTENKYSKNTFERLNKKRGSIPDNNIFNFNKYLATSSKNQTIYKSKKEGNRINFYNQLNIITSTVKNDNNNFNTTVERKRASSIYKKNCSSNKVLSIDNIMNLYSEIREKKDKIIKIFKNNNKITSREESFYILATSPILRLNEQLIFSRATKNIRNVLPISNILKNHNIFLNAKANELINEISLCEKTIRMPFIASKIADITLNFITSIDEQEFRDYDILENNKNAIKNYYIFLKLLYILLNSNYDKDLDGKKLKNNLFEIIKKKGFKNIKDYLYYIYIAKKEDMNIVTKIEVINNEIINKYPEVISFQETFKICRFTGFTIYLIKEIINYANNIKDTFELKFKAQNLLEIVIGKIDRMQNKNSKIKKKKYN